MPLDAARRAELEACLRNIQTQRTIDSPLIERALITLLRAVLQEDASELPA